MTGATQMMRAQSEVAHNLANADTVGFKAQLSAFQPLPVQGPGMATRINGVANGQGVDLRQGGQIDTGRDLDIAVQGEGWIAVQSADGGEAYTRAGELRLTPDGLLTDARGNPVMGDGGPITLPPDTTVQFAKDGTVNAISADNRTPPVALGRLKLVNIDPANLDRGTDGLFRQRDGQDASVDEKVRVTGGALEGSNVNLTDSLVNMIEISRQLEMQMKALHTGDTNAQSANELLRHA
jgi:flagellar basal-body rod protein FlgF